MATQRQKVIRNDGGVQVVEVLSGGGSSVAWGDITGKPTTFAPVAATASVTGGVKQAATQANSTATDAAGVVADLNALLAKLKAAGIMA
ncbi:head fiber protein [Serratia proteamaculans]|uniref:head fiber protein n=1 Tax=Serratia proteamaculans TaxID=28151 RepID=UPI002179EAF4|nr:head fiber protein [Serratia proteamaculans]CAI1975919.1 Head fiber protein [Serratia proteamaculans]